MEALTRSVQLGLFMVDDSSFSASMDEHDPLLLTNAEHPLPQDE